MKLYRRFIVTLCIIVALSPLAACSTPVEWDEEVLLNTGETILVRRKIEYALRGGFGNPADIAMRPTNVQQIRFTYSHTEYMYEGRINLILLAISPDGKPNLVAPAADYNWANDWEHKYSCVVPFYVQLVPDSTGKVWTWPKRPESWLFGLPSNLMVSRPGYREPRKARYDNNDRVQRDSVYRLKFPPGASIDPSYKAECVNYPVEKSNGK